MNHKEETNTEQFVPMCVSVAFIMPGSSLSLISHSAHFGKFSKRLSDFKHLFLSQMTTKNDKQYMKI